MKMKTTNKTAADDNELKTYVAPGLMELSIRIPIDNPVRPYYEVLFQGGQFTGYGMAPAKFSTDDPQLKKLLDKHPKIGKRFYPLKDGKIDYTATPEKE